jgi:hypothetical protein
MKLGAVLKGSCCLILNILGERIPCIFPALELSGYSTSLFQHSRPAETVLTGRVTYTKPLRTLCFRKYRLTLRGEQKYFPLKSAVPRTYHLGPREHLAKSVVFCQSQSENTMIQDNPGLSGCGYCHIYFCTDPFIFTFFLLPAFRDVLGNFTTQVFAIPLKHTA